MALRTNREIKKIIVSKFHKKFLKKYLKKNKLKIKNFKYAELLYAMPYVAFVCELIWIKDIKKTYRDFEKSKIVDEMYDFFFKESTQKKLEYFETISNKTEEFQKEIFEYFTSETKTLCSHVWDGILETRHLNDKSILTIFIVNLMCYLYVDDVIGNFSYDINKMLKNEAEYNRNVNLFQLKLQIFKSLQEIIVEADQHMFSYLIVGINMISKGHLA